MEQILAETSQFTQYRGGLGYLYLDGKLLELLSIYLGEVLELDILMGKIFPCLELRELPLWRQNGL